MSNWLKSSSSSLSSSCVNKDEEPDGTVKLKHTLSMIGGFFTQSGNVDALSIFSSTSGESSGQFRTIAAGQGTCGPWAPWQTYVNSTMLAPGDIVEFKRTLYRVSECGVR